MTSAVLERITRLAPLGLEFRDQASGRRIGDGLVVRVMPPGQPRRSVLARPNPSGIHVAHDLLGLGAWSHGGAEPLPHPEFEIKVEDRLGRFLPCNLRLALPEQGLAKPACLAANSPPGIPLFSAPTRIAPGLAVIRAELFNPVAGKPAAWAVLAAEYQEQQVALGMADGQGRILLAFAYPEPALSDQPLAATTWPLILKVHHQPELNPLAAPELCRALTQPAAGFVTLADPLTLQPSLAVSLKPGQELRPVYAGSSQLHIAP